MVKKLLNKNRSKDSVNQNEFIPIELNRNVSFFHDENMLDTVDTMQVYNDEKDKSGRHRLIFTLYPVFTNVLYNKLTEIVYKEGNSDAGNLPNTGNYNIKAESVSQINRNRVNCIRNTEFTNKRFNLTYHCGVDIFNNHLFRSKENISVQKKGQNSTDKCKIYINENGNESNSLAQSFNTIGDYCRNYSGADIKVKLPGNDDTYKDASEKVLRLYTYDTIKSFKESINDNIQRKNGWIGFTNKTTLEIPVSGVSDNYYYVNKVMNDKDTCQFIDLCPERDLFYFSPKQNDYRRRLEYNWDYCLTYPYESEYNGNYILEGNGYGLPLSLFGDGDFLVEYDNANGIRLAMFRSIVRHNLNKGDNVILKFYISNGEYVDVKCDIVKVGDFQGKNNEYYFSVRKSDYENYIENNYIPKRFIKSINGYKCEYYFRKFKKLEGTYNSSLNNLAFAKTIYGDEVSQIIYTDDINIENYRDNRGKPLSELYLTIIKKNKGYKLWYEENKYNNVEIECSHVFGNLTSGLDLPSYVNSDYPVVRKQHNINGGNEFSYVDGDNNIEIEKSSKKLESDIDINKNVFFGDLVEFNPITQEENILEDIMYRFNTAQRETSNNMYGTLYYDEIYRDIYDSGTGNYSEIFRHKLHEGYANLSPEGYVYKPHYKVKLIEFDKTVNQLSHSKMDVSDIETSKTFFIKISNNMNYNLDINHKFYSKYGNKTYEFVIIDIKSEENYTTYYFKSLSSETLSSLNNHKFFINNEEMVITQRGRKDYVEINFKTYTNYSLMSGDIILLLNKGNIKKYRVNSYSNESGYYLVNIISINGDLISSFSGYNFFKYNLEIPDYGYIIPDGSGRVLWKNIKSPSEYGFMDDLYKIPFTNGAFYHHMNINFYVKRQDPFRKYNMFVKGIDNDFEIKSNEYDYSFDEFLEKNDRTCF